jgi:hypothetical protein
MTKNGLSHYCTAVQKNGPWMTMYLCSKSENLNLYTDLNLKLGTEKVKREPHLQNTEAVLLM